MGCHYSQPCHISGVLSTDQNCSHRSMIPLDKISVQYHSSHVATGVLRAGCECPHHRLAGVLAFGHLRVFYLTMVPMRRMGMPFSG